MTHVSAKLKFSLKAQAKARIVCLYLLIGKLRVNETFYTRCMLFEVFEGEKYLN